MRASVYPFGRSLLASSATGLTEREVVILKHLAAGTPRVTIARQEVVSINTVKTQISRLYRKLDASNAADAASHGSRPCLRANGVYLSAA